MYRRLSAVLFPVMTLFFIGSIYWGYQEHQEKNSILIKAENQYQRAFHDLSYHVEQLHRELGSTLAVNTTSQAYQRKGLVNVWRLTSQAQNEINQLPLTLLPFNTTEEFLSKIANFAYKTSVRDLSKQPLSPDEYKTLKTLYANSEEISQNLLGVQSKVLAKNLRWMDVEVALASEQSARDNTIIDGFKTVDKKVSEYPEINWGPSVASMYQKRSVQMLGGTKKTPEDIKKLAADFLKVDPSVVQVVENGKGTEYESFTASVKQPNSERLTQMDFTKKGGQLIWYMNPKEVTQKNLNIGQAEKTALQFLNEHGYKGLKLTNYDEYNNVISFTAVGTQQGVLIYPEKLTIKVALDDGEVTGLQANDYVYEHHTRKIPKPKLAAAKARTALNPELKVESEQLAIILNDMGAEVLTYEFTGKINGGKYRIYINANTSAEEAIEQLP
ncbi:spore germination protein [Paenibacillus phyllosphaerae]|uniref:Spore germination protein n=1 Tax=Paenibacillus phyllosphaerae TaxID=274593 RepID=A0A7W5FLP6_9BACL|nr:germination protein YpeB [Paenibacillus phyllosphaerae]MBB3109257.1 spore germination protein [Paenibacillus phyllosphaerae]